jgi:hypothetical protein
MLMIWTIYRKVKFTFLFQPVPRRICRASHVCRFVRIART